MNDNLHLFGLCDVPVFARWLACIWSMTLIFSSMTCNFCRWLEVFGQWYAFLERRLAFIWSMMMFQFLVDDLNLFDRWLAFFHRWLGIFDNDLNFLVNDMHFLNDDLHLFDRWFAFLHVGIEIIPFLITVLWIYHAQSKGWLSTSGYFLIV